MNFETDSPTWRKSSFSGNGGCVEVAPLGDGLLALRNSKNPDQGHLVFTSHEWQSFLSGVRKGEFDHIV